MDVFEDLKAAGHSLAHVGQLAGISPPRGKSRWQCVSDKVFSHHRGTPLFSLLQFLSQIVILSRHVQYMLVDSLYYTYLVQQCCWLLHCLTNQQLDWVIRLRIVFPLYLV